MAKELTESARTVLSKRYLLRDKDGKLIEDPDGMFKRVAKAIARAEPNTKGQRRGWGRRFYKVMADLDFLPNSPCLANAGKSGGQLSACFVIPVPDSLDGIFEAVKAAAIIHKTGGGTGFSFNRLRARDALVTTTGHVASGPVSFMGVFDAATQAIKQGGMRRGANMGILNVDHPDILEFIHCKDSGSTITNFNISVGITDQFMDMLGDCLNSDKHDPMWANMMCACNIWDQVCESAYKTGDPGLWFVDRVNAGYGNVVPSVLGDIESCNPCGEQELPPWGVCTLGSVNVGNFIKPCEHHSLCIDMIDFKRLGEVVEVGVRLLDNVIDVNCYPLPEIERVAKGERRIGLGVMGWHDLLIQMGVDYDSTDAIELGDKIMSFIDEEAWRASNELAKEKGVFELFPYSIYAPGGRHPRSGLPVRNATRTTIAPTGTISLIADCSSGIEPLFALSFEHAGLEGSLKGQRIENRFAKGKTDIKVAHEINPIWHIRHQAAFQKYTDNAVSKTINLPESATIKDVGDAYKLAWDLGCKGITVYRNLSREGQVLNDTGRDVGEAGSVGREDVGVGERSVGSVRRRPEVLDSKTYRQPTPFGNAYVTVTEDGLGQPIEIFASVGKAGNDVEAMTEAACRTASIWLRESTDRRGTLERIAKQWAGIGGSSSNGFGVNKVRSVPDALSRVLYKYLNNELKDKEVQKVEDKDQGYQRHFDLCQDCGAASVVIVGGCSTCMSCGSSKC